jgi:hypothetical protein
MASGHMNRVKRPDTWLHRPMLQNVKKVLANPEPSTHDPNCDMSGSNLCDAPPTHSATMSSFRSARKSSEHAEIKGSGA